MFLALYLYLRLYLFKGDTTEHFSEEIKPSVLLRSLRKVILLLNVSCLHYKCILYSAFNLSQIQRNSLRVVIKQENMDVIK